MLLVKFGGGVGVRLLAIWFTVGQLIWFPYWKKGLFLGKSHHHFRGAEACIGFLLNSPPGKSQEKSSSLNKSCFQTLQELPWVNGMSKLKGFSSVFLLQFSQIENNCVRIFSHLYIYIHTHIYLFIYSLPYSNETKAANNNKLFLSYEWARAVLGFITITLILNY